VNETDNWQVRSGMTSDPSRNAMQYVRRLVSYIKDPSTVRARTLEEWSTCPSIEEITKMRKEWEDLNDWRNRGGVNAYTNEPVSDSPYRLPVHPDLRPARAPRDYKAKRPPVTLTHTNQSIVDVSKLTSTIEVIVAVCVQFDVSAKALMEKSKLPEYVQVRHFLCALFLARGASKAQAGGYIGGYDRSAVRFGLKAMFNEHMEDPFVRTMWRKFAPPLFKEVRDLEAFEKHYKVR